MADKLTFVITLTDDLTGINEPVLLIGKNSLELNNKTIGQNLAINETNLKSLNIKELIKLESQNPIQSLDNFKNEITSYPLTLIYNEESNNKALLTKQSFSISKNNKNETFFEITGFTVNKPEFEVVDLSSLENKSILTVISPEFITKMKDLIKKLKNENNRSELSAEENDPVILFKEVLTLFIKLTNEKLNIPNIKKFLSFNENSYKQVIEDLNKNNADDSSDKEGSKLIKVDKLSQLYRDNKTTIDELWKGVDFSGFKKYEATKMTEKDNNRGAIKNDLMTSINEKNEEKTDEFFEGENPPYKGLDNEHKNVILKQFVDYLYRFKNKQPMFKSNNKEQAETMNFLIDVIESHVNKIVNFNKADFVKQINDNSEYVTAINIMTRNLLKTNILTFIKIRNDQHTEGVNNARFNIELDQGGNKQKHMLLQYNDDNEKYYEQDVTSSEGKGFKIANGLIDDKKFSQYGNDIKINNYDRNYIFGEFTQIFKPEMNNQDISKQMKVVTDQLISGKNVFIMGYGASGAGKTSTLIYFNQKKENGILIELCNIVASNSVYKNLEIDFREFYNSDMCDTGKENKENECEINPKVSKDSGRGKNKTDKPVKPSGEDVAKFTFSSNEFHLQGDYTHTNEHPFRVEKLVTDELEELEKKKHRNGTLSESENNQYDQLSGIAKDDYKSKKFINMTKLGDFVRYLIDDDRHVKATTNNPNSSRSHSLIFVKFKGSENSDGPTLIVGDFAGVENEFDCENKKVKEDFINIKSDRDNKFFYRKEVKGDILDPIGQFETSDKKLSTKKIGGGEKIDDNDLPLFDPEIIETNFTINKDKWIAGGYDILENFTDAKTFSIFANIFIKSENKEFTQLKNEEYEKLHNSFKNYKFAANNELFASNDKIDSDTGNLTEGINATGESKAFAKAFKEYIEFLKGATDNKRKLAEYDMFYLDNINYSKFSSINKTVKYAQFKSFFTVINNAINNVKVKEEYDIPKIKKILIEEGIRLNIVPGDAKVINSNDKSINVDETWNNLINNKNISELEEVKKKSGATFDRDELREKLIGPRPGGTGSIDSIVNSIRTTYNAIKTSAQYFLEKLGINDNYNKYFFNIIDGESGINPRGKPEVTHKITYEQNKPFENLRVKLNLQGDNINPLFIQKYVFGFGKDFKKLKTFIDNMLESRDQRLKIGDTICKHRRTEGYFINDSLKDIRSAIRDMLYEKNKDALSIVPNYVDICFDKYCPNHENCFAFDKKITKVDKTSFTGSVIFDEIFNKLKPNSTGDINALNDLYKNLLVGVFCVVNVSKKASNPPPVPYIDINELKRVVYYNEAKDIINNDEITNNFVKESLKLINTIDTKYIDKDPETQIEKNKVQDIIDAKLKPPQTPFYDNFQFINKESKEKTDLISTNYNLFKTIVYHLLKKSAFEYSDQSGGAKINLDKAELLELDLLRLFILKDWANVSFEEKLDTRSYASVYKTKSSNKYTKVPDIDKYIKKKHNYFINEYNKLFNYDVLKQLNDNKRLTDVEKLSKNEYKVMASNIRFAINNFTDLSSKLKTNNLFTIWGKPETNNTKKEEHDNTPNQNINLAIDEIKIVIDEYNNSSDNKEKQIEIFPEEGKNEVPEEKTNAIREELEKIQITEVNKLKINNLRKIENDNEKSVGKLNVPGGYTFIKQLQDALEKGRKTQEERAIELAAEKYINNLPENELPKFDDISDYDTLSLQDLADSEDPSVNSERGEFTLKENIDKKLIEEALKSIKETDEALKEESPSLNILLLKEDFKLPDFIDRNEKTVEKNNQVIESRIPDVLPAIFNFLELVDNSNAISTIGTIEFTDKLAKLNTVATICNDEDETPTLFKELKENITFEPLYKSSITSKGGKTMKLNKGGKRKTMKLSKA